MGDDRKCSPFLEGFYGCLGRTGRDISQCERELGELKKCADNDKQENYCVSEMSRLLRCTRNPDSTGCAKEFIVFRECHRPTGREIVIEDNMYKINYEHMDKYNVSSGSICPVTAPTRDKSSIKYAIDKLREACGFKNFEDNFNPKIKT